MNRFCILFLSFLSACGTYLGTDGVYYYRDGLPEGAKEAGTSLLSSEVVQAGLTGLLGPLAPYTVPIGGIIALLTSFFITKRKKKGL